MNEHKDTGPQWDIVAVFAMICLTIIAIVWMVTR